MRHHGRQTIFARPCLATPEPDPIGLFERIGDARAKSREQAVFVIATWSPAVSVIHASTRT